MLRPWRRLRRAARVTLDNLMRSNETYSPERIARLYETNPDPWSVAPSDYELGKHRTVLAALSNDRYSTAVEVGCAIGVLTSLLAERCDALLALDLSDVALGQARERNAQHPHVRFERRTIPEGLPAEAHDLIVLSEILYYLSEKDADRVAEWVASSLNPGGDVMLVNWLGHPPVEFPRTGDAAAEHFIRRLEPIALRTAFGRHPNYRFDILKCTPGLSEGRMDRVGEADLEISEGIAR